jgi:hypothetical protein
VKPQNGPDRSCQDGSSQKRLTSHATESVVGLHTLSYYTRMLIEPVPTPLSCRLRPNEGRLLSFCQGRLQAVVVASRYNAGERWRVLRAGNSGCSACVELLLPAAEDGVIRL